MPRYLVTGAAGFIASKVCEVLLLEGHTVIGADNFSNAYDIRLKQWRQEQLASFPAFSFFQLDVSRMDQLERAWENWGELDGVVNLAAWAGVRMSVENPWLYVETNITGTVNLLEMCRRRLVPKFVLASTSSLYSGNKVPYSEEFDTNAPLSPYAASKKAAEAMCATYHFLYGTDVSVLRYFTVYGPAGRPDMSLFRFVQWVQEGRPVHIFGDGLQVRDFTYVDDIARGTVAALKPLGLEIINLGSDRPIPLLEALRTVERTCGKPALIEFSPAHKADMLETWANIAKAERLLQWAPTTSFEAGVERLVRWYGANRDWARHIRTQ